MFLFSNLSFAFSWQDLWFTKNQQAQKLMKEKNYKKAEFFFNDAKWKGVAAFRAKDYQRATTIFKSLSTESGFYNAGNALAQLRLYKEAIESYKKALHLNPQNSHA